MSMSEAVWHCICGKRCKLGETCSPKCAFIKSKMNTPFAQAMDDIDRVMDFFGRMYDKQQQALSKPVTKKRK